MIDTIAIVIPARNEQDLVTDCLDAIAAAIAALRATLTRSVDVTTLVVLDSCTDDSPRQVMAQAGISALVCSAGRVGKARSIGIDHLLATSSLRPPATWIANTDADSRVPSDWLIRMLEYADLGAELVLGTVLPDDELAASARERWLRLHDLTDGHPHVHGANLGIRADTYTQLGGFPLLSSGEDVGLVEQAVAAGVKIARTSTIPVVTSARVQARAPLGFADYVQTLLTEGAAG